MAAKNVALGRLLAKKALPVADFVRERRALRQGIC